MPIRVKSAEASAKKWVERAAVAVGDYKEGIDKPKREWQAATKASEAVYVDAVTAAIGRGAFGKGVDASSDAEWKKMAQGKGAANYPRGVRDGAPKYRSKMGPVLSHMSGIDLPPPGMRGSPANIARSVAFQTEMAKFRTG